MTYDDGILKIYRVENVAEAGKKPVLKLYFKGRYYYHQETLGYGRYYAALNAGQRISAVFAVPGWEDIQAEDICVPEDGQQYKVQITQRAKDEDGIQMTRITLERLGETYGIAENREN